MPVDNRHKWIVYGGSVLAALIGLLFGWFPGADLGFLIPLWFICIALIFMESEVRDLGQHLLKLCLAMGVSFVIIVTGIELATLVALPVFWIVNPVLNYFFTYRVLRITSTFFADGPKDWAQMGFIDVVLYVVRTVFTEGWD